MSKRENAMKVLSSDVGIVVKFANGETVAVDFASLSEDIRNKALAHGIKQKLVDAAAIGRDPETGRSATVEEKEAAVKAMAARLNGGEWNTRGEGGGGSEGGLLLRALIRMYPAKTKEQLVAYVDGLDKKQQAALRANPKVVVYIDQIRAESAKGIDSEELLAGLED